jgi:periplasmic protein TonB
MLNVLLESRAPRPRRMGSTVASALLHAALITGAVALTMPGPVKANGVEAPPQPPIWVVPPQPQAPTPPAHHGDTFGPTRLPTLPVIAPPDVIPDALPPIELGLAIPPDRIAIGRSGVGTASPLGAADPSLLIGGVGGAIDERLVDRAPRLIGRAQEPRYPAALRDAGVQGRVVVQFVVDTLGRAELGELRVVQSAHPLFVESVQAALARYRFSVGEAGGRKVRTRVQIPFDFTLVR